MNIECSQVQVFSCSSRCRLRQTASALFCRCRRDSRYGHRHLAGVGGVVTKCHRLKLAAEAPNDVPLVHVCPQRCVEAISLLPPASGRNLTTIRSPDCTLYWQSWLLPDLSVGSGSSISVPSTGIVIFGDPSTDVVAPTTSLVRRVATSEHFQLPGRLLSTPFGSKLSQATDSVNKTWLLIQPSQSSFAGVDSLYQQLLQIQAFTAR
jgi:hypothetical protein